MKLFDDILKVAFIMAFPWTPHLMFFYPSIIYIICKNTIGCEKATGFRGVGKKWVLIMPSSNATANVILIMFLDMLNILKYINQVMSLIYKIKNVKFN